MTIPKRIHQTWKTKTPPWRWQHLVDSVQRHHPGWEYRLWTDDEMDDHVRTHHPDLHPVYASFEKIVMKADVFRYVVMHDFGGLYCDLDYGFIRPYPYGDAEVVLGEEFSPAYGDPLWQVANYVFASRPGHPFWRDLLDDLIRNPPRIRSIRDIVKSTGPRFMTRVFEEKRSTYQGVVVRDRPTFSPMRMRGANEEAMMLNMREIYGIHHAWGSWKERWSRAYFDKKLKGLMKR